MPAEYAPEENDPKYETQRHRGEDYDSSLYIGNNEYQRKGPIPPIGRGEGADDGRNHRHKRQAQPRRDVWATTVPPPTVRPDLPVSVAPWSSAK